MESENSFNLHFSDTLLFFNFNFIAILKKKVKGLRLARMKICMAQTSKSPTKALYKGYKRSVKT